MDQLLDLQKTVQRFFKRTISNPKLSAGTSDFIAFEEITLKLFLLIAEKGEYNLLAKKPATPSECYAHWEQLVDQNNKLSGNREFMNILDKKKGYNSLLREYNMVKANLIVCCFDTTSEEHFKAIKFLASRGYPLDKTDDASYVESINKQLRRSENLITRINMKYKEIEAIGNKQVGIVTPTFDSLMAGLIFKGYTVTDDITLVRYNELKKLIEDGERTRGPNKNK